MAPFDFLWFLLPVAAASGWFVGRHGKHRRESAAAADDLRSNYFKGINYLLNEQPDKAIEALIKVLEVDSETVETHLALGNLYRRRGEVDLHPYSLESHRPPAPGERVAKRSPAGAGARLSERRPS